MAEKPQAQNLTSEQQNTHAYLRDIMQSSSLSDTMLDVLAKRPQTQYGSLMPIAMDMPPRQSAGRTRLAMPDIARAPMESLVHLLKAFENPSQAKERVVTDILTLFTTGRGLRAATKVPATIKEELPVHSSVYGFNYLRDLLSETPTLGYADAINSATLNLIGDVANLLPNAPKGINIPIEPRKTENTTYKLKGQKK